MRNENRGRPRSTNSTERKKGTKEDTERAEEEEDRVDTKDGERARTKGKKQRDSGEYASKLNWRA